MIEPLTIEEVKSSLVQYITLKGVARLEELAEYYNRLGFHGDFPLLQTVLAELVMGELITEKKFRGPTRFPSNLSPVQFLYFTSGTHEAHLLQKEMAARMRYRPKGFDQMTPEQQWEWDKALGVLDYRGEDT